MHVFSCLEKKKKSPKVSYLPLRARSPCMLKRKTIVLRSGLLLNVTNFNTFNIIYFFFFFLILAMDV